MLGSGSVFIALYSWNVCCMLFFPFGVTPCIFKFIIAISKGQFWWSHYMDFHLLTVEYSSLWGLTDLRSSGSLSSNHILQSRARFEEPILYTVMNTLLIWKVSESWIMCGLRTPLNICLKWFIWVKWFCCSVLLAEFEGYWKVLRLHSSSPSTEINALLNVRRGSLPRVMFVFYGCMWEAHMERAQCWCESTVTVVKGVVNPGPFTFMIWMK